MEAGSANSGSDGLIGRLPPWLLGLAPILLIASIAIGFGLAGAPGLGDRNGPPVEDLVVEKTTLNPGEIELLVRNDGPDAIRIAQVAVNEAFYPFTADESRVGRLGSETLTIPYPWIEGEAYGISLLLDTGGTIEHTIDVAVETPQTDLGFFGLMALLGIYVGVIPVSIGMLWLPFVRRLDPRWMQLLMAFTIGLLAFLGVDAVLEGLEFGNEGAQAFGGTALVWLGLASAFLVLTAISSHMGARRAEAKAAGAGGFSLALLIAIGIGLHNLGEGIAIGSAYAGGALALGAFLVIGFALHNTTEGLAIVAPLGRDGTTPTLGRLAGLGLVAGAPAVLGAWFGAAAFSPAAAALLFGVGAGAIFQVIVQLTPAMRNSEGEAFHPLAVGGILTGFAVLYATSLLISV